MVGALLARAGALDALDAIKGMRDGPNTTDAAYVMRLVHWHGERSAWALPNGTVLQLCADDANVHHHVRLIDGVSAAIFSWESGLLAYVGAVLFMSGYFVRLLIVHCCAEQEVNRGHSSRPAFKAARSPAAVKLAVSGRESCLSAPLNDFMRCPICMDVLDEPSSCCAEGHVYCAGCISEALHNDPTCPTCRTQASTTLVRHRSLEGIISALPARCRHGRAATDGAPGDDLPSCSGFCDASLACDWRGTIGELAGHLQNECQLELAPCPNKGCRAWLPLKDVDRHASELCEFRTLTCQFCSLELRAKTMQLHLLICPRNDTLSATRAEQGSSGDNSDIEQVYAEVGRLSADIERSFVCELEP
mmetsp:Transcript_42287/g.112041  ORF Transcript_42287/g.112041 Transcript_42287/m.112041 type:complete len:362 (-) Transcript_42287:146-1231(-)